MRPLVTATVSLVSRAVLAGAILAGVVLAGTGFSGCAAYWTRMSGVREDLVRGDLEAALRAVEKSRAPASQLLYLTEKGLVLHYAERYAESNETFDQAEMLVDDLYTKSLSRELGSLVTSDNILQYRGEKFERVFINYYRALNYVHLGQREAALVECRKVNQKLQQVRDSGDADTAYPDDAFIQYLTGILYEWGKETNEALISYRAAEEGFQRTGRDCGVKAPRDLALALLRTSEALGFTDLFDEFRRRYADVPEGIWRRDRAQGWLVVLHENGFIPHKIERDLNLPILESDSWEDDDRFALTLEDRMHGYSPGETKVRYWLRVALPAYAPGGPVIAASEVRATREDSVASAPAAAPAAPPTGEPGMASPATQLARAEDLAAIARDLFAAESPTIIRRTIVRALAKYAAHEAADKKGEGFGILTNILGAATESADTRSWLTLPSEILSARLELPPGSYRLEFTFLDQSGDVIGSFAAEGIQVRAGDTAFLSHRTY